MKAKALACQGKLEEMNAVPLGLRVRQAAKQKILFLPHAVRQMSRPERMISAAEVRRTVELEK